RAHLSWRLGNRIVPVALSTGGAHALVAPADARMAPGHHRPGHALCPRNPLAATAPGPAPARPRPRHLPGPGRPERSACILSERTPLSCRPAEVTQPDGLAACAPAVGAPARPAVLWPHALAVVIGPAARSRSRAAAAADGHPLE